MRDHAPSTSSADDLFIAPIPGGATVHEGEFSVEARSPGGDWQTVPCYGAKLDFHDPTFQPVGLLQSGTPVELRVTALQEVREVRIRPDARAIPHMIEEGRIRFTLHPPEKIVLQTNGEKTRGLHLFLDLPDTGIPDPGDPQVIFFEPGLHDHTSHPLINRECRSGKPAQSVLKVGADTIVYVAAGAVVRASIVLEQEARDVVIRGRGVIDLLEGNSPNGQGGAEHGSNGARGVKAEFARNLEIRDLLFLNPPHYTVFLGQCRNVHIDNIKSFSSMLWSDGIDMMSSNDVLIENVFMRNSDDCIAIYGHRWDYYGDVKNIVVRDSILWADKAHPYMVGTHGEYQKGGNVIEDLVLENVDILEHDERNDNYQGAVALNANDGNRIRNVLIKDIRVERISNGKILDLRVFYNPTYGNSTPKGEPAHGREVEMIRVVNLSYTGEEPRESRFQGVAADAPVRDVVIENMTYRETPVTTPQEGNLQIGPHVRDLKIIRKL